MAKQFAKTLIDKYYLGNKEYMNEKALINSITHQLEKYDKDDDDDNDDDDDIIYEIVYEIGLILMALDPKYIGVGGDNLLDIRIVGMDGKITNEIKRFLRRNNGSNNGSNN